MHTIPNVQLDGEGVTKYVLNLINSLKEWSKIENPSRNIPGVGVFRSLQFTRQVSGLGEDTVVGAKRGSGYLEFQMLLQKP